MDSERNGATANPAPSIESIAVSQLAQALTECGAEENHANDAARAIAKLADDYVAWFGASDSDDIALPIYGGLAEWHKRFTEIRQEINVAAEDHLGQPPNGEVWAMSMGLACLQVKMGRDNWSALVRGLDAAIEASLPGPKPRKGEDRATRNFIRDTAVLWQRATGKWPALTKNKVLDSPLLDALAALVATHDGPNAALTDDKFERAVKTAKRVAQQARG